MIAFRLPYALRRRAKYCLLLAVLVFAAACSPTGKDGAQQPKPPAEPGIVVLPPDSPKRAYLKITPLQLSQRPLLEPLAGKIVYDEHATSRISSPVAGRVVSDPAPLGAEVDAGQPLVILDSPEVAAVEAEYLKAEADLGLAAHAYKRQQELYAGKAAARKDVEQAQDALAQAQSEAARTRDRLKNLHLQAGQSNGRFALKAPLAGTVSERHITPGMEVRPDLDDPLFVVSDLGKLSVLMEIFEVNLPKIKPEQRLSIAVPAYPGEQFPATVKYVGQVLDETTRTVQVRCALPNPDKRLLPGMYATVNVLSEPGDQAVVVPLTAVFTEDEADYVFVALDHDRYQKRAVRIGLRLKDRAVVEAGLAAGENLVAEGALMLRTEEDVEQNSAPSQEPQP